MLAKIVDNKYVYIEQATPNEHDILDKEFSVEAPNARFIDKSHGFFDGIFHKYNKFKNRLARPLLDELIKVCEKRGLPLKIDDIRPPSEVVLNKDDVIKDLLYGITLDDHQVDAIKAACDKEVGIVSCPTGAGKTEIIAGITKVAGCTTVILADMKVVVDQIKTRLELRKVTEEVGLFYAGKRPNGQNVIVGSIQSLNVPSVPNKTKKDTPATYANKMKGWKTRVSNAKALRAMVSKCDLLLVDEADQAVSKPWKKLFAYWFRGRRRYGFSGTPFSDQKPVEGMVLKEHLGSIIYSVSRDKLEAINRIIPVEYTAIAFGENGSTKDKSAYDIATKEKIIENEQFHKAVALLTEKCLRSSDRHGVLILVESKNLGYALESMIENSKFICGDHSMSDRRKYVELFENRDMNVLIGGRIVKRGLDLKGGCESLILASGGKLDNDFSQKVGRAVRLNSRGKASVYDFLFLNNHYLYAHSRNRIKTIVAMGYPAKVVFKHGVVSAESLIKSRWRRPRPKRKR